MIFVILARLPKDVEPSYQGKIRKLLTPHIEDMSKFDMKTFIKQMEDYEEKKNLFALKEKTKVQANVGKGKEPNKPFAKAHYDKSKQPKPDQASIKKLRDVVMDESKTWSNAVWENHKNNCHKVTFKTNSYRICYWCIDEACLKKRGEAFKHISPVNYLDMKNGEKYISWRIRMDKGTSDSCSNFAALTS